MSLTARLAKRIEDTSAEQEKILNAAQTAEGGERDLNAEETAAFDKLAAEKAGLKNQLSRAKQIDADKNEAREAARAPIVQQPHTPNSRVFAQPRRHAPLKAFHGADAVERAEAAGMWAAATLFASDPRNSGVSARARQWCLENGILIDHANAQPNAVLTSTNNSGAGFFVPHVLDNAIIELAEQFGVFRQNAEIQPMSSETWEGPRWTNGMTAYWTGHGQKPAESNPAWDKIGLVAKDLTALSKMTRQLNEDSIINLGDKVAMSIVLAFAYAEDNAGFNGDGTSAYGGITGLLTKLGLAANAASLFTAATGNTTPDTLDLIDFTKCMGKLPQYPNINPKWYCSKEVWTASMLPLMLNSGGARPEDIAGGGSMSFLGRPVVISQVMPQLAAATAGTIPIAYGDLALAAKLGDRRGVTVESGFENDDFTKQLMTILGTERVDINVHTVVDPRNSAKAGPVVGLKLAAA